MAVMVMTLSAAFAAALAKEGSPTSLTKGEQAVGFFQAIGNWVKEKPILAVLILVVLVALIVLAVMQYKNMRLSGKAGRMAPSFPVNIGNAHHIGARDSQQDAFGISDISNQSLFEKKGVFAVVADGMGGLSNGAEVSAIVTTSMLKYFNERPFHSDPSIELLNMMTYANGEVNRYLGRDGRGKSGSTVVCVLVHKKQLYWLSVGDSRICLVRNGALIQANREHTFGPDLDERAALGEISYEAAKNDPQRAALTSYLGMGKIEKIDRNIRPLALVPGDRILLMSDGVFGTLTDEEILSAMHVPPFESAAKLERMILSKGKPKQDNFTAVVLECL